MATACAPQARVPADFRAKAETWVAREVERPAGLTFSDPWLAGGSSDMGVICGEVLGLPQFDEPLKYTFIETGTGLVEPKLVGLDPLAQVTADQMRATFDQVWTEHCAPFRPGWSLPDFGW